MNYSTIGYPKDLLYSCSTVDYPDEFFILFKSFIVLNEPLYYGFR